MSEPIKARQPLYVSEPRDRRKPYTQSVPMDNIFKLNKRTEGLESTIILMCVILYSTTTEQERVNEMEKTKGVKRVNSKEKPSE